MKRRRFIQALAVTPAMALPGVAEAKAPQRSGAPASQGEEGQRLETAALDAVAESTPRFFNAAQFATLRKLCDILQPPLNGMPGALDAGAPEFLDFLISKSPAERQQLYRAGLDALNTQATRQFKKSFAEVDEAQAGALLAPLRQPWTYTPPADPLAHFLREARQDARTATVNSQVYVAAAASGGRRGGGMGQYWLPLD
jgi:hypothetical protein